MISNLINFEFDDVTDLLLIFQTAFELSRKQVRENYFVRDFFLFHYGGMNFPNNLQMCVRKVRTFKQE